MLGLRGKTEHIPDKEKMWEALLREYNYLSIDAFDLVIAEAVEAGYFDWDSLLEEANKLNKIKLLEKSQDSFRKAWQLYHDSFDDNVQEVIKVIEESFRRNVHGIYPMELDGTVRLLRELGNEALADNLLQYYITHRKDEANLFDLENYGFALELQDEGLREAFQKTFNENGEKRSLEKILGELIAYDKWHPEDEILLAETSVEEFYRYLKNTRGAKKIKNLIDRLLRFGRLGDASDRQCLIAEKVTQALKLIGRESRLNSRRIAKFGVISDT